jgi:hypothetical protein
MRWTDGLNKLVKSTSYICWHGPKFCGVRFQSKLAAITITSGSCIKHSGSRSGEQRQRQRLLLLLLMVLVLLLLEPSLSKPKARPAVLSHTSARAAIFRDLITRMPIGSSRPRARISKDDDVAA